jgi:hypothetical protein
MSTTEATSLAAAIRANLQLQPGERLYTVVDACQDAELAFEAQSRFGQPIRMLFKGAAAQYMRDVAPYFIPIDLASEYLERWAAAWGKNAGILLTSSADPGRVFRHLREIFVVKDGAGQEYFFRFYDPRALRVFLPTCTPEETKAFLGPINSLLVAGSGPGTLLRYAVASGKLVSSTHNLPV